MSAVGKSLCAVCAVVYGIGADAWEGCSDNINTLEGGTSQLLAHVWVYISYIL